MSSHKYSLDRLDRDTLSTFKRDTIRKATNWRVRPIFSVDGRTSVEYGWNLIDPRGLVRASFYAPLNEVADVARREMKGMRA